MNRSIFPRGAVYLALLISSLFAVACVNPSPKKDKPLIALSILPQQWFVHRIAGNLVDTVTLVNAGQDPHSWEPSPRQMELFNRADAWILSGTDFELALAPRIRRQSPNLMIIDGTAGVRFRSLATHSHDGEDEDHHDESSPEIDRHTWLGREPAKILARHVADALSTLDPPRAELYKANLEKTLAEIDGAFDGLVVALAPLKGSKVFVYHPSFGYFLDEFGIQQEAVETGGKEPTAKGLAALIEEARADRPAAVFVQAQFPATAAKTVADAIGARVIPLDPLAADWLENVRRMGQTLLEATR